MCIRTAFDLRSVIHAAMVVATLLNVAIFQAETVITPRQNGSASTLQRNRVHAETVINFALHYRKPIVLPITPIIFL